MSTPTRVTIELYSSAELEVRIRQTRPSVIDTVGESVDEESGIRQALATDTHPGIARCPAGHLRLVRAA